MPARSSRPSRIAQLVDLARLHRITSRSEAAGRCLAASLDFAIEAREAIGCELDLVRWHIDGDPDYLDHWAVAVDDANVIDLTRVQVDGNARLLWPVGHYPAHYGAPRRYAASLLSGAYASCGTVSGPRLPDRFLWTCGTTLLRVDLARAGRALSIRSVAAALKEAVAFVAHFSLRAASRWLGERAGMLAARLHEGAEFAVRASRYALLDELPEPKAATRRRA